MWRRLTEVARRAVYHAQAEAQRLGHDDIAPEHLLLGLLREPQCAAVRILEELGHSIEEVKDAVEDSLSPQKPRSSPTFTLIPSGKKSIDLAYWEAKKLGDDHIGTQHFLLGMLVQGEGVPWSTLTNIGIDQEKVRATIKSIEKVDESAGGTQVPTSDAWDAYDVEARTALEAAGVVASESNNPQILPEHILIALLQNPSILVSSILADINVDPSNLRAEVEQRCHRGDAPEQSSIGWSARATQTLMLAQAEQTILGSPKIAPEHLLLALARVTDGAAGQVLIKFGAAPGCVREIVRLGNHG